MRKGWCPRHDKMFEAADGVCPECGTALVDVGRARSEPRIVVPDDEPPAEVVATIEVGERQPAERSGDSFRIGTPMLAGVVAAIVLAAFLVGLAFPRSRGAKTVPTARPTARAEFRVGREFTASGVRLRLESVSQRGRRIVLRVTVPNQPSIDIGRIRGVAVASEVARGSVLEEASLEVRTTIAGFIAEGPVFERDDLLITGIRIVQLEMTADGRGRGMLDLSSVWPDEREGPLASARAVRIQQLPGRTMRVVGLVGWPDHLEVQFEERGVPEGWTHADTFTILTGGAPAAGEVIRDRSQDRIRFTTVSFQACGEPAFQCVPRGLSRVTLVVDAASTTIAGRWAWELA